MTTVIDAFSALADPTRCDIVARLSNGPASVSELAQQHDMSLRGFLKHVQVLEDAGLVTTVKQGRVRRCELRPQPFAETIGWLDDVRARWERRIDRIEAFAQAEAKR